MSHWPAAPARSSVIVAAGPDRELLPLLRQARAEGRVDVTMLADQLEVTVETIRRDLTMLERAGVLRRVNVEERWLGEIFSDEYSRYRREVPALVPFLRGRMANEGE